MFFPHPHLQSFGESRLDGLMSCFALCAELGFCFSVLFQCLIILSLISDVLSKCLIRMQSIFANIEFLKFIHTYAGDPNMPFLSVPILIAKVGNS